MVGFTTTIPLEIIIAAGKRPVDLNNIFITDPNCHTLIDEAEMAGFPRNCCGWIKGLYSAALHHNIREIIAVTEGDCSNTKALMEVLQLQGITTVPFAYPYDRSRTTLEHEIHKLAQHFDVTPAQADEAWHYLNGIRAHVHEIDRLTWEENRVTGEENHFWQVCTSDMNGDPQSFQQQAKTFLEEARQRQPLPDGLRLAYIGVPPIFTDLYAVTEELGARVVFNETQRQFSMPYRASSLIEQYRHYTYPYDVFVRLDDIEKELSQRRIDGVIHYVQSFCFRQIEDLIVRQRLKHLPILTLEGDRPGPLDARTRIRLEGFVEMVKARRS
ncbi:(R)-2-hydroxyacyl-CoA dehydratase [Syntrophotalea carbinolica DSM 2380]|uniref:(R)-2-hydroxyacyl-CoA dehydratase n=1 Tax=Syntrophotalea carbinolica (strain DSM 2380 / NBRC 103641 / GraBd1) TaxID=338963 RepID=Q3A0Z5_SYNC1|nr:2-hydroxyacyl-CoA dehydratase [Syntrophotalea carbinolica]ABA89962.1 (R)-2-hydroxyacyl-CoA dehydratase [Syntrophotalea carbinolica DSM 2380]